MARFKVGDWVRCNTDGPFTGGRIGKIARPSDRESAEWLVHIDDELGEAHMAEHELEPAPPPVGERKGHAHSPGDPEKGTAEAWYSCPCRLPDFDPANWCPCTPEPTDRAQQRVTLAREIEIEYNDTKPDGGTCKRCGQYFEGVVNSSLVHDCSSFKPRPESITPNATDELSVYCPHYSVRGRACLECRNRAARARKARGGGA